MSTTSGRWCRALHREPAVVRFADDVDGVVAGEDGREAAAQELVVVDEHHADALGHRCA
jgi:hypothetical protein